MLVQCGSKGGWDARVHTPVCDLGVRTETGMVTEIAFLPQDGDEVTPTNRLSEETCRQLQCYLGDPEFRFDLPLEFRGSSFQRSVWSQLMRIPPGRTLRYGDIAANLGTAARAVGQACGNNPLVIIIPCHRVVASHGLGGFSHSTGGLPLVIKSWLLDHESRVS